MSALALLLRKNRLPPEVKIELTTPNLKPFIVVFPPMYGLTKAGGVKWYEIEVLPKNGHYEIHRRKASKIGGKAQIDVTTIKSGVNIGKKNETTAAEQAVFEAESMVNRLRDQGYKSADDLGLDVRQPSFGEEAIKTALGSSPTDAKGQIKPMLAGNDRSKIVYPCHQQPKLNGHRALALCGENGKVALISRKGKPIYLEKVSEALEKIMKPGEVFDGELYCAGMALQEIASAVKTQGEHADKHRIQFVIFDVPAREQDWNTRLANLNRLITLKNVDYFSPNTKAKGEVIAVLLTFTAKNEEDMMTHHNMFLRNKYEGSIVRNLSGKYEFGYRSKDLIKIKESYDDEFKIVGVEEATGRDQATAVFVLELPAGGTFKARPEGTYEQRAQYWHDRKKLIGKMATIKYNELTPDGVPFHPVALGIREDL